MLVVEPLSSLESSVHHCAPCTVKMGNTFSIYNCSSLLEYDRLPLYSWLCEHIAWTSCSCSCIRSLSLRLLNLQRSSIFHVFIYALNLLQGSINSKNQEHLQRDNWKQLTDQIQGGDRLSHITESSSQSTLQEKELCRFLCFFRWIHAIKFLTYKIDYVSM